MKRGVIYFVVKKDDKHLPKKSSEAKVVQSQLRYAEKSAKSMKKYHRDIPITLYSNLITVNEDGADGFDDIIYTEGKIGQMWAFKHKILAESPYERTLHIDADTIICSPIYEVFDVLDKFDLAMPLSLWYGKKTSVPVCFPELAGGFFTWRNNEKMRALFKKIRKRCLEGTPNDEPIFRVELYNSDIRFMVLPLEYNCVTCHPGYLYGNIKVAHGRTELVEEAKVINSVKGLRIFTGGTLYELERFRRYRKFFKVVKEIEYGHFNK